MWFDGDDDDQKKQQTNNNDQPGPETGNYDLPDDIGAKVGETRHTSDDPLN